MPKSKTFYIIDGHAHIYRAYFAPFRDLSSPSGEPTKATYVFTQMLLNLIDQVQQHLRSEEHTSELQSRRDLVCRLLLEKKKSPQSHSAPGEYCGISITGLI